MRSTGGAGHRTGAMIVRVMRFFCASIVCVLLGAGCHKPMGTVLGKVPKGEARTILAVRAGDTPPQVTLTGIMIEKCPVAGCWFRLRDVSGSIKVDTKLAGFVVVNVPLETKMTVAGKIVAEGDDVAIEATGIRY
jgi:uncharacterized protein YdeI (BOF family)